MAGNNLQILNTGLDHLYINGIPIVEAEIDINDIYKKVARISSLAVQADPWFNNHTNAQKLFSELHGEGSRIARDFVEEGARELLSMFTPYQRLIPEGAYDTTPVEYEFTGQTSDFSWNNPDPSNIFITNIIVTAVDGFGSITFKINGEELGTKPIPDYEEDVNYLAYDLAGYLGGEISKYINYSDSQNARNNIAQLIELIVSNTAGNFTYDIKICAVKYDAIGWIKGLTQSGDIYLPTRKDDIRISYLMNSFEWNNNNQVKVNGVIVKHNAGSANVTIKYNGNDSTQRFLDRNSIGEDYYRITDDIMNISVELEGESEDFNYDLIINTEIPDTIPSPRFEFDSNWNPDKIIFRYQNMDTRLCKLNYTSETLRDIRIDPNIFDEVLKYLKDSLKNYLLKELYEAIGYDKKAIEYFKKYEQSRIDAKFWLRSEKGLQTQYNYAGI